MIRFAILLFAAVLFVPGMARAQSHREDVEQAMRQFDSGQQAEALRVVDDILRAEPFNPNALIAASTMRLRNGDWTAAVPLAERLTSKYPAVVGAWQTLIQLYQLTNQRGRRDSAIEAIHRARSTSVDPNVRKAASFIRDRIIVGKLTLLTAESFDPYGGVTVRRWVMLPEAEASGPRHWFAVVSDDETNQRFRDSGALAEGALAHRQESQSPGPQGRPLRLDYEFYIGSVDYDTVRAKVIDILNGRAKSTSGAEDPFWTAATR
jgi:hypothetical protein